MMFRRVLVAGLLVVSATACGSDDADTTDDTTAADSSADATTVEPEAEAEAENAAPETTVAATDDEMPTTTAGSADGETRTVETMAGAVEIPVDPERITALDEYVGMSMLALGITPTVVYGSFGSEVGQRMLADAGAEIRQVENAFAGLSLEDIAATNPDVIVFSAEAAFEATYQQYAAIAPSIVLRYTEPWRDVIAAAGTVFDREPEAAQVISVLEGQLADLSAKVADQPTEISILADTYGMLFAASMESPLARLMEEVGINRPDAQTNGTPDSAFTSAIMISPEVITDHDADVVVVLSGVYYNAQTLLDMPTFQGLPAVQDGRSVVADGDLWFGTFPFAIYWLVTDLNNLVAGQGQDGVGAVEADFDARWADYQALMDAD